MVTAGHHGLTLLPLPSSLEAPLSRYEKADDRFVHQSDRLLLVPLPQELEESGLQHTSTEEAG